MDSRRPDIVDGLAPDTTVDAPAPDTTGDAPPPDTNVDASSLDTTVDAPAPDTTIDAPAPDTTIDAPPPDSAVDVTIPDGPATDTAPPLPAFVTIAAGSFTMGSPASEPCHGSDETEHQVTLTRSFELQSTEVTQAQFQSVMGYAPSSFSTCGTDCPVETVSWHEAAAYCNALSSQKGIATCYDCTGSSASVTCQEAASYTGAQVYNCPGYRLPTDAEWEYAYRAGTTTAYYSGASDSNACDCEGDPNIDPIAWYCGNAGSTTHPVAKKQANAWGIYDMAGNVYEWCHDGYQVSLGSSVATDPIGSGSNRVYRGGSWQYGARRARAADRDDLPPALRFGFIGFRCARTIAP